MSMFHGDRENHPGSWDENNVIEERLAEDGHGVARVRQKGRFTMKDAHDSGSPRGLEGVTRVVCLLSDREIAERNPEYLSAIVRQDARLPRVERFPVPDLAEAAGSAALAG